jgi:hypothetical protein
MSHLRRLLLALLAVLVLVRPGNGCSFSDDDLTPSGTDPDRPYSAFLDGKLGIVSGQLRIRHLVVAYDMLSGRGLTPSEQKAAVDVDRFYNFGEAYKPGPDVTAPADPSARNAWNATSVERAVPGAPYETFTNCLDDTFVHANTTLANLRAKYGKPDSAEIQDWIAGQAAVFSNCSDGHSSQFQYPTPPPPPPGVMPNPAPAGAPLWLRQQRAYQIAAAQFYALDYDSALAGFRAISADKASPLAPLARYVEARVLIRKSVVPYNFNSATTKDSSNTRTLTLTGLTQARDYLQTLLRDPAMTPYHTQSQHLLDYVMVRLDPAAQADELARRLSAPPRKTANADLDTDYRQNVIDLTYAYNSLPLYSPAFPAKGTAPVDPKSPLLRWINDLSGQINPDIGTTVNRVYNRDPAAHTQDALALWRSTHQPQWLTAALIDARPGNPGIADLIDAARTVPPDSAAWATDTYHRLRLQYAVAPRADGSSGPYNEVAALMPTIERTQPRSTISLFADLESSLTPTLDLFLKTAPRITAHTIQEEPGEGFTASGSNLEYAASQTPVTLCGVNLNAPDTPHFDASVALIFNQRMPLHLLSEAALSPALPNNLRFQLAHMAWTRALLLDDAATARSLAPYLAQCQPAFKTWLDQYNAAKTSDERHVLGHLALMRFTSTEPTVRVGSERDFAAYDSFRDNWWCDADNSGQTSPPQPKPALLFSQPIVPATIEPDPPFLTAADRAAAEKEIATLQKTPGASDYFAQQALDWVKAHPDDPHNADLLGFAMRVVRNACRDDATKDLSHQLFDTIHRRYPKSEWATRYATWE